MNELQPSAQAVWQQVISALGRWAERPSCLSSMKQAQPLSFEDGALELLVATEFARDWLTKRRKTLEAALEQVAGTPSQLVFTLGQLGLDLNGETPAPATQRPHRRTTRRAADDAGRTPLNPRYVFDHFVVGKGNQFAHAAALAVARKPGHSYNPLFLFGGVGLGKTHLMQAIGHEVASTSPELRVEYVSGDTFTFDVVSSIREDKFSTFRRKYHDVDVWLVDDIQFIAAKERTEAEFFQVFNTLCETGRQVVIASDRPPKELQVMDDRLRSRFEWGLTADIKPPDLETRIAILARRAEMERIDVPDEVLHYIAKRVKSNIRVLEGALITVLAHASLTNTPISLALAAEQLQDHSLEADRPLSIGRVQQICADHFNMTVTELNARTRKKDIVEARQLAMFICRDVLKSSFPAIARGFGGKDHSTVIHACDKIRHHLADESFRTLVNELIARLRSDL